MDIEDKVFARCTPDFNRLVEYGFVKEGNQYHYQETFFDGHFQARISVNEKGEVHGAVWDLDADEEFDAIHIESFSGGYIGEVREAYRTLLQNIKNAAFAERLFFGDQANRIAKCIYERYRESPDQPFKDMPGHGVFRHPESRKWYGLIMSVPRSSLSKNKNDEGTVDVMNLKLDLTRHEEVLNINGVIPAYHMNHKQWISVLLDETVPDETVMQLVDNSRRVTASKKKKASM